MCTLTEALWPYYHLGYTFSNSKRNIHLLQYADDTCLISEGPASCQELIRQVEKWLQWTGMQAKPAKCHSLGIRASSGASFDPGLSISDQPIQFINNQKPYNSSVRSSRCLLTQITRCCKSSLDKVKRSQVTRQQKLRLHISSGHLPKNCLGSGHHHLTHLMGKGGSLAPLPLGS